MEWKTPRIGVHPPAHTCTLCLFNPKTELQDPQLLLELYEAMGQQEAAAELHLQAALEMAAGERPCCKHTCIIA